MIDEIRAEYLLTKLYPELDDKWVARHKGTFYRNYMSDVMNLYDDECLVELSRDSFLRILPDSFLTDEDELRGSSAVAAQEQLRQRLHLLEEAFMPVDTQRFKSRIQLERAIVPILDMKLRYILKEYFDYDLDAEKNEYIAEVAPLLPYVRFMRGDIMLIHDIIQQVMGCTVQYKIKDYSCDDNTLFSMPIVLFTVREDNLTAEEYLSRKMKIDEFLDFLKERFLPVDMLFKIRLIGNNNDAILLEYNSWTTTQEYAGNEA